MSANAIKLIYKGIATYFLHYPAANVNYTVIILIS